MGDWNALRKSEGNKGKEMKEETGKRCKKGGKDSEAHKR